jgi:hypothetical protein
LAQPKPEPSAPAKVGALTGDDVAKIAQAVHGLMLQNSNVNTINPDRRSYDKNRAPSPYRQQQQQQNQRPPYRSAPFNRNNSSRPPGPGYNTFNRFQNQRPSQRNSRQNPSYRTPGPPRDFAVPTFTKSAPRDSAPPVNTKVRCNYCAGFHYDNECVVQTSLPKN